MLDVSTTFAKIIYQSKDRTLKRDFNDGTDFLNALFFERSLNSVSLIFLNYKTRKYTDQLTTCANH